MTEIEVSNRVILGYHSPTEWVFFPEVIALYDCIIINKAVFEETIGKGLGSASIYRSTKAALLSDLGKRGVLIPTEYPVSGKRQDELEEIVDYFFMHHEAEMRRLLIYAFEAFIKHEKDTLEKLVDPDDPYWQDVAGQLPRLERVKAGLISGTPLDVLPQQRQVAKRYFEDAVLTPIAFQTGYNPVFQWEGYGRFEQFLLSFRRGEARQRHKIERGSELHVLKSLSDIVVPFRIVRSPDDISKVVSKWKAFAEIRQYIRDLNKSLWDMICQATKIDKNNEQDFVYDFNALLRARMSNINQQIQQIDYEVEKKKTGFLSRITRFIIATLGSIIPGTGGFAQVLEDAHSALVKDQVKKGYSSLAVVFEYERILSSITVKKNETAISSVVGTEYEPVKYWDEA